jgi:hypothetical protein
MSFIAGVHSSSRLALWILSKREGADRLIDHELCHTPPNGLKVRQRFRPIEGSETVRARVVLLP